MRNKLVKAVIATLGMSVAVVAQADVTWSFTGSGTVSDSFEFVGSGTPSGVKATTSGWSDPSGGNLNQQTVERFGGGLGIRTAGVSTSSPNHAVGNGICTANCSSSSPTYTTNGPREMVLFSFTSAVTLKDVSVGWSQNDSDISVLAYTGSLTSQAAIQSELDSKDWTTLTGTTGWDFIGHYFNAGSSGVSGGINAGNVTSSYWLVGALNNKVATSTDSNYPDFVKIASLTGIVPGPPVPGTGVPEPASLLLLAAGLPLLRKTRGLFPRR